MKNERTIEALNALIAINSDRIESYESASKETQEKDLKSLFGKFAATSRQCRQELIKEVVRLGGRPSQATNVSGKFFRAWMENNEKYSSKDRDEIICSCVYGENIAHDTYDWALKYELEYLNSAQKTMINSQKVMLSADHIQVKLLQYAYSGA